MFSPRQTLLYLVVLPAILAAAGIVGYFSYRTARELARWGEQSIIRTTLILAGEKVDRVEQRIIDSDNAVFHMVDLANLEALRESWLPLAERVSPSIQSVLVLDDSGQALSYVTRADGRGADEYLKLFLERILPDIDLELERDAPERHRHLHRDYGGRTHLVSYLVRELDGQRFTIALQHNVPYLLNDVFPALFADIEGKGLYNVVDEQGRIKFGRSLAGAGDFIVARRFPTTLYEWRLQLAPKEAELYGSRARLRRYSELSLLLLSLAVLVVGVGGLVYGLQKERYVSRLKSEFIANVSHELKTPLSLIRMFAEMLLSGRADDPDKQRQYYEIIVRESERLTALIDNVLDFARIERGRIGFSFEVGDLGATVERATEILRQRFDRDEVDLRVEVQPGLPPLRFDRDAVTLVVLNLLDNAAKYASGGKSVFVAVTADIEKREVRVAVTDQGPGIPPDEARHIFERFYRGSSAKRSHTRGSGIGLALVKHIAKGHGGMAWVERASGAGARFVMTIPIDAAETDRRRAPGQGQGNDDAEQSGARAATERTPPAPLTSSR